MSFFCWFIIDGDLLSFDLEDGDLLSLYVSRVEFSFSISSFYTPGGNGYINDYPTGRLLRDAKLYEIGAGTSEIRRLIIGRALNAEYK